MDRLEALFLAARACRTFDASLRHVVADGRRYVTDGHAALSVETPATGDETRRPLGLTYQAMTAPVPADATWIETAKFLADLPPACPRCEGQSCGPWDDCKEGETRVVVDPRPNASRIAQSYARLLRDLVRVSGAAGVSVWSLSARECFGVPGVSEVVHVLCADFGGRRFVVMPLRESAR